MLRADDGTPLARASVTLELALGDVRAHRRSLCTGRDGQIRRDEAVRRGADLPTGARALGGASYTVEPIPANEEFNRLVQSAVARHPILGAQVSQAAIARAETKAARAALYPRLSANVDADYVIARRFGAGTTNVVESLRPEEQVNVGVTASQLLFDGGATFAREIVKFFNGDAGADDKLKASLKLLADWDGRATPDSRAMCTYCSEISPVK